LVSKRGRPTGINEIIETIPLTPALARYHIGTLERAGIVDVEDEGESERQRLCLTGAGSKRL
jgi:DNA-binding transcriptional ArsR family regulator